MKIAFLGTGLMGSGFVRRLLANGHDVQVWNRTPSKASALQSLGARVLDDPGAAIAGVERIHLSLSDDASVDAVLEPMAAAVARSTWIVDHTTTAVTPTALRVARVEWVNKKMQVLAGTEYDIPANLIVSAVGQFIEWQGMDGLKNAKDKANVDKALQVVEKHG